MALREFSDETRPIILENDPAGNSGGLGGFHTSNPEDREPNNMPKIVGGLVVALMLGTAGAYVYSVSGKPAPQPQQVAANSLPAPAAPAPAAAPAPMPASDTSASTPAPTPAADTSSKPEAKPVVHTASVSKPVRAAKADTASSTDMGAANARMQAADNTPTQAPQQAVTAPTQTAAVPEPVSPQAPASATASVAQPANPEVAPQPAQSSTPSADAAAPAQDQQTGATPAPAAQSPQQ